MYCNIKRLALFWIFLPVFSFAQNSQKYPTLLWKISGKHLKKPSYLYGTMHVSNKVAYYLSEQFFSALKSVDIVGLETNPGEWLENMEKTGELDEAAQFRPATAPGNFYRNTFVPVYPDKKLLQGILSYDPDIINGLLYRQNGSRENFEESTYIDLFIYQSAAKLNKQLISLEDFRSSEIKARLAMLPDEEPESKNSNFYALAQKIEDAYRAGNLDLLDSLSKLSSTKNTQRYLINDRNVFFVETIDSVLRTNTLFSGVGAAHLPGESGVIELLRKKGYTVEPVFPEVTKKSNAYREELDKKFKVVPFSKQVIADSAFSLQLPGKLYPIVNLGNLKYYIHADMVNGSFYTVVRLRHQGPAFHLSAAQLKARVDSLLFESIPGKILVKKDIESNTGIRGIEIINQTRRGDEQHYQIFFTDVEMILFKLGGKQGYATSNESKNFFNSIQFRPAKPGSFLFSPATAGFSVKIPHTFFYNKNSGSSLTGLVENLYAYNAGSGELMGVQQAVYNDFAYLEEDSVELNSFASSVLSNFGYSLSPSYELSKEQGLPAIRFSGKDKKGASLNGKFYLKGVHYYFVYVISENTLGFEHEFFKSFQLLPIKHIQPIKEISDRDFCFKAKDEVSDNALSRFNEDYVKAYQQTKTKKDTVKPDFEFRSSSKMYYSPSSNEYINLTFEKYNDYDFKNPADLEKKIKEVYTKNYGMLVRHAVSTNTNGLYTFTCTLADTATARAILLKVFVKSGFMLDLSVPCDTTLGLSGWASEFFHSIQPMDTVLGKPLFENKFAQLLEDLGSADTSVRRKANVSVAAVPMQKAYHDDFIKFISGAQVNKVSEDSRAQLFVNGGTLESDEIIGPYKKLYKQYTDSFYLQLCLLKGLAYQKTVKSYTAFYELLMNEPPLVGADNSVADVFNVLHDSLELSRRLFPGILALTKYDEYKDAVYSLMADLVDKNLLVAQDYSAQKPAILGDAELALKRFNPQNLKTSGNDQSLDYLEKGARELAESIRSNLDGLSTNNYFKGTDFLKEMEVNNRQPLVNYAILLAPFYNTDQKVKQFYTKLSKVKAQAITMPVLVQLLKRDIVWNDTLVSYYSKNKNTRTYFYTELEKQKLSARFDQNYLSQQQLIESVVLSQRQLNSIYAFEKDKKSDSLVLIKKLEATNKYQKGHLYIYRISSKTNDEQWAIVFVENTSQPVNANVQVITLNYYVDPSQSQEANLNEIRSYFANSYRKRAQSGSENYE